MEITSPAFKNNAYIPTRFMADGTDMSPALKWSDAPEGTQSFALIMEDPDCQSGSWVHWLIYDLPGDLAGLEERIPREGALPDGTKQGLIWGVKDEDCKRVGYFGPEPPRGELHRYFFKLYALDKMLGIGPRATKSALVAAMEGHILDQAEIVGLCKR